MKWISVKEQLPEQLEVVNLYIDTYEDKYFIIARGWWEDSNAGIRSRSRKYKGSFDRYPISVEWNVVGVGTYDHGDPILWCKLEELSDILPK